MLPRRKCLRARVFGLVFLVITFIALLEHWRGGKRLATANPSMTVEDEYEHQVLEDEARIIPWLGHGGVPVHMSGMDADLGKISLKNNAINVYLSDRIPYNRSLGDIRHPSCSDIVYDAELPSVSVILIFHNEPFSVVLRTIWSVLNTCKRNQKWYNKANYYDKDGNIMRLGYPGQDPKSEYVYLKEIILVDDNSTLPELKGKLSHYIRTRLPPDLIRILRLPDRKGLMRARTEGARLARGKVLLFLDSHCEAGSDWLRPLLQRIVDKHDAIVTPLIDVIDENTFKLDPVNEYQVGGFNFNGDFTWIPISKYESDRRGSEIGPTWSPTMAGGLFAIDRAYFWQLGGYDEQMSGWGGENLEMSFRVWMCGGTLEIIPCSRVGHIFRSFHPYGLPASSDTFGVNTARVAEVWMDQYKELFYLYRSDLRNNPVIGDVTHRKILREKLQCKSFQWYLDHIYRDKFVPIRDVFAWGRIMNPTTYVCIDNYSREPSSSAASVYPCHADLKPSQFWSLTRDNRIRSESACLDVDKLSNEPTLVMVQCEPTVHKGQEFRLMIDNRIQHIETGLCIEARHPGDNIRLSECDRTVSSQKWKFDFTEDAPLAGSLFQSPGQVEALEVIRGKRRQSRSLLEDNKIEEDASLTDDGRRRGKKSDKKQKNSKVRSDNSTGIAKKSKVKDKFILTLVRTVNNKTEHLEMIIQCKHALLKPNNAFVRDIVSLLNSKDIAVINNGRVFRHNVASELTRDINPLTLKKDKRKKSLRSQAITTDTPENIEEGHEHRTTAKLYHPHQNIVIEEFVKERHRDTTPTYAEKPKQHSVSHSHAALRKGHKMKKPAERRHKDKKTGPQLPGAYSLEDSPLWEKPDETHHFRAEQDSGRREGDDDMRHELQEDQERGFKQENEKNIDLEPKSPIQGDHRRKYQIEQIYPTPTTTKPVEFLLRSNLTFILGEDFFNWRRDNDEVSPPADSLAIPESAPVRTRLEGMSGEKDNSLNSNEDYPIHVV